MTTTRIRPRDRLRAGLDALNTERLFELAVQLGVDDDGRSSAIRKRLVKCARLTERRLADFLSLHELADACRALDLDAHGTEPDELRARLLGVEAIERGPVRNFRQDAPEAIARLARTRRWRIAWEDLVRLARRWLNVVAWALGGGVFSFFLVRLLTDDLETRGGLAAMSCVTVLLIKFRHYGRFRGLLIYGVPMIAATYLGYEHGWLEFEMATHSRLTMVWGTSVVAGAFIGLSEEIGADMRR